VEGVVQRPGTNPFEGSNDCVLVVHPVQLMVDITSINQLVINIRNNFNIRLKREPVTIIRAITTDSPDAHTTTVKRR